MNATMNRVLIVDVEATCEKDDDSFDNETIEIGGVVVDERYLELASFQKFIRPKLNPTLSNFCNQLTGITQSHVDSAEDFCQVIEEMFDFCALHHVMEWGSWGQYDQKQLKKDANRYGLKLPDWFNRHTNFKKTFIRSRPGKLKQVGLPTACRIMGVDLVQPHHRALSDARTVRRILEASFSSEES